MGNRNQNSAWIEYVADSVGGWVLLIGDKVCLGMENEDTDEPPEWMVIRRNAINAAIDAAEQR